MVDRCCCGMMILFLVQLLMPAEVAAQDPIPPGGATQNPVVPLQFNFSDPGARSIGFGGAFVALGDDATAAFANPAGLVQLLRPEVSIEGRSTSYSTPFTEGGRLDGVPSGVGIDTTLGIRTATSDVDLNGLSFLSLAYPIDDWSLAFFRKELANFEFFSETQGLFSDAADGSPIRLPDQRASSDLKLVSYGFSAAYRISDKFSVGLGVVYHDASFVSDATLFAPDDDSEESLFALNSYFPERSIVSERNAIDDADWTLTGGFLWRLSERWSIGGVYREAPKIEIGFVSTAGEANERGLEAGEVLRNESALLELPKIYGLGLAYRAHNGRLTLSFQWDRVEYSSITESIGLDDRTIDDVDQLHLGAEYVFLDSTPIIAVRLATWLEPDNQLRATSDEIFNRALLPRGEDDIHFSAGLGVALPNFQLDLGFDLGDRADTVSLSAIFSF